MLKSKIKISQINNLTDARYFSAWGVDYLGFDIDPESLHFISPPQLQEISDWIEGPTLILEVSSSLDEIWIDNYRQMIGPVTLELPVPGVENLYTLISDKQDLPQVVTYRSDKSWSEISRSYMDHLVRSYDQVFLDILFDVNHIEMILESGISGLVLRGGEEEKVGFKSYDDLDKIFESLEI